MERSCQFSLTGCWCFCTHPRVDTHRHTSNTHTPPHKYTEVLTNGAVLSVPALVTLALPVLASSVFDAERVAHSLVTACAGPALLTATSSSHTHSMGPAVNWAHLWRKREISGSRTTFLDWKVDVFSRFVFICHMFSDTQQRPPCWKHCPWNDTQTVVICKKTFKNFHF